MGEIRRRAAAGGVARQFQPRGRFWDVPSVQPVAAQVALGWLDDNGKPRVLAATAALKVIERARDLARWSTSAVRAATSIAIDTPKNTRFKIRDVAR